MARITEQERLLASVGAAVGSRAPREDVTLEILQQLRGIVPYEAMSVAVVDPFEGGHRTLVNDGYSDRIIEYVDSDYSVRDASFAQIIRARRPYRMRDTDFDYHASYSYLEYWGPAGYGDGMTTPLFSADGRYVGLACTSTVTEAVLTDDVRDFMELLSGVLGAMVDPLADVSAWVSEAVPERRLLIREDGAVAEESGADALCGAVDRDAIVRAATALRSSTQIVREGLVQTSGTRLVRMQLTQTRSQRLSDAPLILASLCDTGPIDLTLRETEVLTLLARGGSNREIAECLGIASRTVATHIEHLMHKLGVATRTAAAALAIERGLVRLDLA